MHSCSLLLLFSIFSRCLRFLSVKRFHNLHSVVMCCCVSWQSGRPPRKWQPWSVHFPLKSSRNRSLSPARACWIHSRYVV